MNYSNVASLKNISASRAIPFLVKLTIPPKLSESLVDIKGNVVSQKASEIPFVEEIWNTDIGKVGELKNKEEIKASDNITQSNKPIIRSRTIIKYLQLFKNKFLFEEEDNSIILSHERWSLVGEGSTLAEAEQDLMRNARISLDGYFKIHSSEMTIDAIEYRDFLLTIV